MTKFPQAPCAACGTHFELRAVNQLYCSRRCKTNAERRRQRSRNAGLEDVLRRLPGVKEPTEDVLKLLVLGINLHPRTTQYEIEGPVPDGWTPPSGITLTAKWNFETNTPEPNKFLINHETLGT